MFNKSFFIIGYSGVGKTTVAKIMVDYLSSNGYKTLLFDGNKMSEYSILDKYNGYDICSRLKRAKQLTNIVNWVNNQNVIPIVAVIGQPKEARSYWRKNVDEYCEIYLKAPIETCIKRDNKAIYKNKSENIVGVDIQFDEPTCSDIILDAKNKTPDELLRDILRVLRR
ncbi:adenylyl-sulfate kinase [bacterium]|jgi:adenylylsulfate kinase-like enzyme|nr:adenylyl-sulfate kinase [bacterium]